MTTELVPSETGRILIVGGYGQVGRTIAQRLAPQFPGRVAVAGRSLEKAADTASRIGYDTAGSAIDIFAELATETLSGVALVIVCLDQSDTRFAEHCLSRGVHYVDISADYGFLSQLEQLDTFARENGATAVFSVGVAPGLTNMLARRAHRRMEKVDRIDIVLELGLGDHHGKAAVEWMFDNLDVYYEVQSEGRSKPVRAFGESIRVRLPNQNLDRPAYCFNFPDQHVIARDLDVASVSTWVRFESPFWTWMFAKCSRSRIGRLLHRPAWRRLAVWLFMNVGLGSDACTVAARAVGRGQDGEEQTLTLAVMGRQEARMTAVVAAETARQLLGGKTLPGAFHIDQAIALESIVSALRDDLPELVVAF